MGVTGLLPQLREAMNTVQFKCLAGERAGICGHSWLYALSMHSASRCLAGQYDQLIQAFLRRCETVTRRKPKSRFCESDASAPRSESKVAS